MIEFDKDLDEISKTHKILILLREFDKYLGKEPVVTSFEFKQKNNKSINQEIKSLSIRQRFNPELQYFIVLEENYLADKDKIDELLFKEKKYDDFDIAMDAPLDSFDNNLKKYGIYKVR